MADYVNIINQNDMIPKGSKVINEQGEEIGTMKRNIFKVGDRVLFNGDTCTVIDVNNSNRYKLASNNGSIIKTTSLYLQPCLDNTNDDTSNPLNTQEGGNHYKDCKIQPIEYITANNLDFMQGNIVKYITRHKSKNGAEDIKKIKHYCDLILKLQYED